MSIFIKKIFKKIAKHSILPATLHKKHRILEVEKSFNAFWGLNDLPICFKKPKTFSTFGPGSATCLWTYYFDSIEQVIFLRNTYEPKSFQVTSSGDTLLCGMHFQKKAVKKSSHRRVFILFNGNGELFRIGVASWLFKLLLDVPCDYDIVMFDPRECGKSTGWADAKGLIDDGETIYQYVKNTLGFHENTIDLYGFSLGGAIATLVKAHHSHTQGFLISNRSFQSLDKVITGLFHRLWTPAAIMLSKIASFITSHSEWVLDPFVAMKMISSPRLIICHEKDPIVYHKASMLYALINHDIHHECHIIYLHKKNPHQKIRNHHVQPLEDYLDQNDEPALTILKTFINNHSGLHH